MTSNDGQANAFPYPIPEYDAEPFWQGCNEGRLLMQRCDNCARYRWHPAPFCGLCGSGKFEWQALSGRAKIHTWTVVTHPVHPAAVDKVPYVVVIVELEEQAGLTMVSNLIDCDIEAIDIGNPVSVDFVAHPNGQKLPVFRLDSL